MLRIDSPGGSAVASDVIWRELTLTRDQKPARPLITSMSDLAASGGYYIAMAGQAIVAQPGTLTGSIGIYSGKIALGGAAAKLGVCHRDGEARRQRRHLLAVHAVHAGAAREAAEFMQSFYDGFVEKVAEARAHDARADRRRRAGTRVDRRPGQGAGAGRRARGTGRRAVAMAKERANIPAVEDVELVLYPPPSHLLRSALAAAGRAAAWAASGDAARCAGRQALAAASSPCACFVAASRWR